MKMLDVINSKMLR